MQAREIVIRDIAQITDFDFKLLENSINGSAINLKISLDGNLTERHTDGVGKKYLPKGSNSLGNNGAIALAFILKSGLIFNELELVLQNQNIHETGIIAICNEIKNILSSEHPPKKIYLDISTNDGYWKQTYDLPNEMSDASLTNIADLIKILSEGSIFKLARGDFGLSGLLALSEAIHHGPNNLTVVFDNKSMSITDENALIISEMIKTKKGGFHLGLSEIISSSTDAMIKMTDAIKKSMPGTSLDLSFNKIDSIMMEKIAAAICQAPAGFRIDLSHNNDGLYTYKYISKDNFIASTPGMALLAKNLLGNTNILNIECRIMTDNYSSIDTRPFLAKTNKEGCLIYLCCFRNRLLKKYEHRFDIVNYIRKICTDSGCYNHQSADSDLSNVHKFFATTNSNEQDFIQFDDITLFVKYLDASKALLANDVNLNEIPINTQKISM